MAGELTLRVLLFLIMAESGRGRGELLITAFFLYRESDWAHRVTERQRERREGREPNYNIEEEACQVPFIKTRGNVANGPKLKRIAVTSLL